MLNVYARGGAREDQGEKAESRIRGITRKVMCRLVGLRKSKSDARRIAEMARAALVAREIMGRSDPD